MPQPLIDLDLFSSPSLNILIFSKYFGSGQFNSNKLSGFNSFIHISSVNVEWREGFMVFIIREEGVDEGCGY